MAREPWRSRPRRAWIGTDRKRVAVTPAALPDPGGARSVPLVDAAVTAALATNADVRIVPDEAGTPGASARCCAGSAPQDSSSMCRAVSSPGDRTRSVATSRVKGPRGMPETCPPFGRESPGSRPPVLATPRARLLPGARVVPGMVVPRRRRDEQHRHAGGRVVAVPTALRHDNEVTAPQRP